MGKKKREHITFDRMADKKLRINKNIFTMEEIARREKKRGMEFK